MEWDIDNCVPPKGLFTLVFQNQVPVRLTLEVHPTSSLIAEETEIEPPEKTYHHPYCRKQRTKEPLDESERGEWKS